jgi:hypothetical protein
MESMNENGEIDLKQAEIRTFLLLKHECLKTSESAFKIIAASDRRECGFYC